MTPTDLKAILDTLRDARLMSFHVKMPVEHTCSGGSGSDLLELAGTFAPDEGPAPDPANLAGGWKGPERLDRFEDTEPSLPSPQG
jgi:hypothetical protein